MAVARIVQRLDEHGRRPTRVEAMTVLGELLS